MNYDIVVIGAGAGGCFAAIRIGEFFPGARICILEAAKRPLSKVEISGGGRCNVTHACFDPAALTTYYPRGGDALLHPFQIFQPSDMIDWFAAKGIKLKIEDDGRMFPVTNSSTTIINCFQQEIKRNNIQIWTSTRGVEWCYGEEHKKWNITLFDGRVLTAKYLLVASGSDQRIWDTLSAMGHHIIAPVPSLFTFNIRDKILHELMGTSKSFVKLSIPSFKLEAQGTLLLTHWGMSGPAILKLSAWGARELHDCGYVFDLFVNWVAPMDPNEITLYLQALINENPKRQINNLPFKDFSTRLWKYICGRAEIPEFMSGAEFGKKQLKKMLDVLTKDVYSVTGKSTFKDEFVTAGGVDISDLDLRKFESKKQPHLFLVGEVLNIDALTGGFNFQAAWTGAHIAATSIAEYLSEEIE